ncbi:hypothetical protein CDAR_499881 [Caerostris darwini]|uniref:Uncharacterized protein n=1 Tax=Caerostris darwini TaxID=1538125 RepID=A0AAV4VEC2_9ARAC|nr:hypothetical protein CDAR_499881 [Caerostris darwini]
MKQVARHPKQMLPAKQILTQIIFDKLPEEEIGTTAAVAFPVTPVRLSLRMHLNVDNAKKYLIESVVKDNILSGFRATILNVLQPLSRSL